MTIEYELEKGDYVEFNKYHMKNSETMKKTLFIQRYIIPIVFLIVPVFISRMSQIPLWYWYSVFIIVSLLWISYYEKFMMKTVEKKIAKMIEEGKNVDLLGKHSINVSEDGIVEKSYTSENKIKWNAVERIASSRDHFFIYISSISAHIIPKRAFESETEIEKFFTAVNSNIARS